MLNLGARVLVLSGTMSALVACAARPAELVSEAPPLAAATGYASYEGCHQPCRGAIPRTLLRSWHLPADRRSCPVSRVHDVNAVEGGVFGHGPVFASASPGAHTGSPLPLEPVTVATVAGASRWKEFKVLWSAAPRYDGPLLIRGRRLDGGALLGFGQARTPVDELQLPSGTAAGMVTDGWRYWPSEVRVAVPGCYGWQLDGLGFSEVIVAQVAP